MSLDKFLQIIDKSFVGRFIGKKTSVLDEINPDRFFVENIRRYYNLPYSLAKLFCEMAVKQKIFNKKTGVRCPNCGRIIMSVERLNEIPAEITCEICELNESEHFQFTKEDCDTIEFYQLRK